MGVNITFLDCNVFPISWKKAWWPPFFIYSISKFHIDKYTAVFLRALFGLLFLKQVTCGKKHTLKSEKPRRLNEKNKKVTSSSSMSYFIDYIKNIYHKPLDVLI